MPSLTKAHMLRVVHSNPAMLNCSTMVHLIIICSWCRLILLTVHECARCRPSNLTAAFPTGIEAHELSSYYDFVVRVSAMLHSYIKAECHAAPFIMTQRLRGTLHASDHHLHHRTYSFAQSCCRYGKVHNGRLRRQCIAPNNEYLLPSDLLA